jgi:tetratricopeptide (TPR) repeat protein
VKFNDAYKSCKLLLIQGQFEQALTVFDLAYDMLTMQAEKQALLELLGYVTGVHFDGSIQALIIRAKILLANQQHQQLSEFSNQIMECNGISYAAPIQVQYAISLQEKGDHKFARQILERAILQLDGEMLGTAWAQLAWSLFELGELWKYAFQKAKPLLSGVKLGLALLNEGHCLAESDLHTEARAVWLEAIPQLLFRPKTRALVRYNLGISALQDLEPEAEHHFLEAVNLTKNPKAAEMRSAVFRGLGASRRVFGEWDRAEFAYRQAVQTATALDDREEAYIGLARTLRLAGRPSKALETLELALHIYDTETPIVNVGRALAFLALNDTKNARAALERVGTLVSVSDQWLCRIAQAELARREGRLTDAVNSLEGLPVQSLHPREEVRQWSKLFELLALTDKPVPMPLEYIPKTIVRVLAQGVLRVLINDRKLELAPTGRPAELLVFLLEQGGMASLEQLMDAFFPEANSSADQNRARKAIWKFSDQLRHALGWQNAVQALRGAYMLDQDAIWQYDINEARAAGVFQGEFLKGVYSSWAVETAQLLEGLSGQYDFKRTLN